MTLRALVQAMAVALGFVRDTLPFNNAPGYSDAGVTNPFVQGQCAITISTMITFKVRRCSCQQAGPAPPARSELADGRARPSKQLPRCTRPL